MTPKFQRAVEIVLHEEGGYSNDPHDRGGETNFGISRRSYPDEDIKAMTRERAIEIYHRDYWLPLNCEALPWDMALLAFDCAVNQGPSFARLHLQEALGVRTDGIIGPVTAEAAARHGREGVIRFCALRMRRYNESIEYAPTNSRFLNGWIRRLFRVFADAVSEGTRE